MSISEIKPIITRASLVVGLKNWKKNVFIFNETCKKLLLCTNILNDSDLLKRFIYIIMPNICIHYL